MSDRQWQDAPAKDGWYWIKPLEHDGKELSKRLRENPCYVYWSPRMDDYCWDHSWDVRPEGFDPLQGRQVCPIQRPPE